MDRTTVMLPSKLKERARAEAKREGISLGELVRRSLEHEVAHTVPKRKLKKIVRTRLPVRPGTRPDHVADVRQTNAGTARRDKDDVENPYDIYF